MVPLMPRARLRGAYLLLLAAGLALVAVVGAALRSRPELGVLDELAEAHPARMLTGRLSISVAYRACTVVRPDSGETVPHEVCGDEDARLGRLDDIAEGGSSVDGDSLRAFALLAMLRDDSTGESLDAAIDRLLRAQQLSTDRAPLLVDLSAAHLARAGRTQSARDLAQALEHALTALELDSLNPAALFNAALAQQALGLDHRAGRAWTAYLRVDSTSDWADEARERRRLLYHPPTPVPPQVGAPLAKVRAFAIEHPREARMYGLDTLLGRWGNAWERGDTVRAAAILQLAEEIGITLRYRGGDASLFDAVGAIRAARDDRAATRALARAHRTYSAGQAMYWRLDQIAAGDSFTAVVAAHPPSPVLMRWAEVFNAASLVYAGKYSEADTKYQSLLTRIDSVRYPALAARALWNQGSARLRIPRPSEADESYRAAARLFSRAGEPEYAATNMSMAGEAAYHQLATFAAYNAYHRGVSSLRVYRDSPWLVSALLMLANLIATDGMPRAAAAVQDEDFVVAMPQQRWPGPTESLIGRAIIRGAAGRLVDARADLDRADELAQRISGREARERLGARVAYARALLGSDSVSLAKLDSAIATLEANPLWVIPAVVQRAELRLSHGDLAGASSDLTRVTRAAQLVSQRSTDAVLRVALLERARQQFDQLVLLHFKAGEYSEALRVLERGRVSFAPGYASATVAEGPPTAPAGQVAVEYALIGDTLLTWTVRGSDVHARRDTVNRADLRGRIERVITWLESPSRTASARPDLERLYDLLIRPVEDRLGPKDTPLVILADGEIAGIPFEVLRDSRRQQYLVENHTLRFAPTLAESGRPAPPVRTGDHALLVADPQFDREYNARLNRLRAARAEVDSLQQVYPRHEVLEDSDATPGAFSRLAPTASVIHYAGHAEFDDAHPEWSALILTGPGAAGRLTPAAVSALDLGKVRLVVLAACQTVRAREGRSGGLAGFSGALLSAGAGGVLGSLWKADDELTQPLMIAFHRAYRESGDPAAALRTAQIQMLASTDPTRRNPAAWAGFRYIGR